MANDTPKHWHIHIKTKEGGFYIHRRPFTSLEDAKAKAQKYEIHPPPWLDELRIYRVEANTACETCEEKH
jgi:hypothetical protein